MERTASAIWRGDLKRGQGTLSTESTVLQDQPYSFVTRFGDQPGTNPEELIAAAHAGCFSMALSAQLGGAGLQPESIRTQARVTLEKQGEGFAITRIHLDVSARVPGADEESFRSAAETAKANCPVSKVLNAQISMNAALES